MKPSMVTMWSEVVHCCEWLLLLSTFESFILAGLKIFLLCNQNCRLLILLAKILKITIKGKCDVTIIKLSEPTIFSCPLLRLENRSSYTDQRMLITSVSTNIPTQCTHTCECSKPLLHIYITITITNDCHFISQPLTILSDEW